MISIGRKIKLRQKLLDALTLMPERFLTTQIMERARIAISARDRVLVHYILEELQIPQVRDRAGRWWIRSP